MQHYEKFAGPSVANSVPRLSTQTIVVPCHHCGRYTRVPVPTTFVDWEKVAESYRKRLEETWKMFDEMSRDVEVMHAENPAAQYLANRLRLALLELGRRLDDPERPSGT